MTPTRTKIDLNYISANSSFIFPLFAENGEKVLEARTVLTVGLIEKIREKHGHILYYTNIGEKAVIPTYRLKIAYNNSKSILDEIEKTNKLTKTGYYEAEKVVDEILNDLNKVDVESIDLLKELTNLDNYLYAHLVNVGIMSAIFAKKIGTFTDDEIRGITLGGYLIDIGQKMIDKQLLNKEGKLDINEFQKMKRHPQLGYEIVKQIDQSNPIVLQSILFHHEKFKNNGYYQLPYEHLPIYPKLISICDIYDALTSSRPFRKDAISGNNALKAILNTTNVIFDEELVNKFITLMAPLLNGVQSFYTAGDICELNSEELALITDYDINDLMHPQVLIFCQIHKVKGKTLVKYYPEPKKCNLKLSDKTMIKLLNNPFQIKMIKESLTERDIL